jgi:hypothetical protein
LPEGRRGIIRGRDLPEGMEFDKIPMNQKSITENKEFNYNASGITTYVFSQRGDDYRIFVV